MFSVFKQSSLDVKPLNGNVQVWGIVGYLAKSAFYTL